MNLVAEPSSLQYPTGWEMRSIGDVFNVVERAVKMDGDQPYRRVTVKRRHGGIELRDIQRGADIKVKNQYLIKAGDFLISERQVVHGACGIVPPELEGALVSNEYLVLEARKSFDVNYFSYLVQLQKYAKLFLLCSQGVDIEKFLFKPQDWLKKEIPVPPFSEQQKIAAVLTVVDDKLDVIARQIEATQTLKRGLMQTLFSRGVGARGAGGQWAPHTDFKDSELGKLPASWGVKPLGELIDKLMDFRGRTPRKLGMDWGGGDIPALSANNVRMGYIDFARECYLGSEELYRVWMVQGDAKRHDLVFTMEAPLGNVAIVPDDRKYILSQRVILVRPNTYANYRFLFQYMRSDLFAAILDKNSTGTTAKGIQQKRLVQLPVLMPPLDEQERIAEVLGSVDEKLNALSARQAHYQTMKRGLMQKLLTGEWRVKLEGTEPLAA